MPYLSGAVIASCQDLESVGHMTLKLLWIILSIFPEKYVEYEHTSWINPPTGVASSRHCQLINTITAADAFHAGNDADGTSQDKSQIIVGGCFVFPFFVQSSEFFWCLLDDYLLKWLDPLWFSQHHFLSPHLTFFFNPLVESRFIGFIHTFEAQILKSQELKSKQLSWLEKSIF